MGYDQSDVEVYTYTDATFGATTVAHPFMGPRGKVGLVRDISVDVSTALVGTTSVPEIAVGIASGDATFGRYRLGSAVGTAYTGTTAHRASQENITGLPPRTLADFTGHVILDGGPLQTTADATTSLSTPLGRIPASPLLVTNVVSGTAGVSRVFFQGAYPANLKVGQTILTSGVLGATGTNGLTTISAISVANSWIELAGTTFGGTYTSGGIVSLILFITAVAGVGAPAGGGTHRTKIQWIGPETV